jgi:hypothetical protein
MSRSPLSKTKQRTLLGKVKTLLQARRNGKPQQEQAAYDKLRAFCESNSIDMGAAIDQGTEYLKRTSIAASMNGIV